MYVDYRFRDAGGKLRKANASVARDWERPGDGKAEILYLESDPEVSRLRSERPVMPYVWLPFALLALALGTAALLRQAST